MQLAFFLVRDLPWSVGLVAMNAAGLSAVALQVTVFQQPLSPCDRSAPIFYFLNGTSGSLPFFAPENVSGRRLPAFLFVVTVSTILAASFLDAEPPEKKRVITTTLGFLAACLLVFALGMGRSGIFKRSARS